ncbi:MAG TPA: protein phosphatase 2C domain-containing protein [Bryobacteraceae bacterium]|nr:protein phosphatase 2C domain-containing protein [Bryobacteraceae bacterium]
MSIESYGLTHPGKVRSENQDRILVAPEMGCFAICDGMGGQRCGEVAAEMAVEVLQHYIDCSRNPADVTWPFGYNIELSLDSNRLLTSIRLANRQVARRAEQDMKCTGMGTTVVALLHRDGRVALANVGDSRIYRLRDGGLEQLSTDDTMLGLLLSQGVVKAADAATHPMRGILTQAIGSQADMKVHLRDEELLPGDLLVLCSDGLHGLVNDAALTATLASGSSLEARAQDMLQQALDAGGADNVSIVLLQQAQS